MGIVESSAAVLSTIITAAAAAAIGEQSKRLGVACHAHAGRDQRTDDAGEQARGAVSVDEEAVHRVARGGVRGLGVDHDALGLGRVGARVEKDVADAVGVTEHGDLRVGLSVVVESKGNGGREYRLPIPSSCPAADSP